MRMPHRIILNPAEGMLTLKKLVGAGWPFAHSPNSASFHSQLNSFSHKIVICDKVVVVIIMTVRLFQMIFSQL